MKILLSFVGSRDPLNPDGTVGPLLSLLEKEEFNVHYLFYNNRDYLQRASECKKEIEKRLGEKKINYIDATTPDPTDYKSLYQIMNDRCQEIISRHKKDKPAYYISTTSGTPQMETIWILLNKSQLVPGKLLQIIEAKFGKTGQPSIREINLTLDDFPQLQSPEEIKRKLTLYKTKSELLETKVSVQEIGLLGESKAFQDAIALAQQYAKYREPILLLGESGAGKEMFAKLIHRESEVEGEFVPLNCAGLNEQLLESELFGHVKGAFTGAVKDHDGLVVKAKEGTLFLDEIAELPLNIQAKLLRFLNDGSYRAVGSNNEMKSNARIIGATNRNLKKLVTEEKFRNDLFQRINTAPIKLPPLRERSEDIELLINHFIEAFNKEYRESKRIELPAIKFLMNNPWSKGNIRELEKMVRRLCMRTDEVIDLLSVKNELAEGEATHMDLDIQIPDAGFDLKKKMKELQLEYINKALELANGNKLKAAKILGVSRIDHFIKNDS